jgi:alkylated DNA repair dioxygenase AlkB
LITGITYVPRYIDRDTHDRLLATVDEHPWQRSMDHRVQVYGYNYNHSLRAPYRIGEIPAWAMALVRQLQQDGYAVSVPNQLVANEYQAGIGIFDHIDQPVFGDIVIAVSLGSTCAMRLTGADQSASEELLIEPQSLLVLSGEARWHWKHGIPARTADVCDGREYVRSRRVSLTFRAIPEDGTDGGTVEH